MPHSWLIKLSISYSTNTMICQLYDSRYRENCINMLSDQNTAMNWNLSLMTACIIVPLCKIKVLKHWKLYKNAYILQESFAMKDYSYPPPCRNYLQPLYLSVTLYACAQREVGVMFLVDNLNGQCKPNRMRLLSQYALTCTGLLWSTYEC